MRMPLSRAQLIAGLGALSALLAPSGAATTWAMALLEPAEPHDLNDRLATTNKPMRSADAVPAHPLNGPPSVCRRSSGCRRTTGSHRTIATFARGSTATMSSARSGGPGRAGWQ
jgi:hypothetical protein